MSKSFENLTILELASVLAGPAVGMFFAELGATVIKVENRSTGGDMTRHWKLPSEPADCDYSAYYCSINWNKQSFLLDLKTEADRQQVYEWASKADVVISNYRAGQAEKLGMDAARLHQINQRLIYAELTGFGQGDDRPAFDVVLQAETGFLYMCGPKGGPPVKMPVALIDLLAAHQLKEGILLALLERAQTGKGGIVRTSLYEAAVASLANQATNWLMAGHVPQPMGSEHPNIAPYGDLFQAKDGGWLVLAVGTEGQWRQFCQVVQPDLAENPAFSTNKHRVTNRAALCSALQPLFLEKDRPAWMSLFQEHHIPAGAVKTMQEVFEVPEAQALILEETMPDGSLSRRVRTAVFDWEPLP